jgi:ABC-type lipoprotein export system ATPase subunit
MIGLQKPLAGKILFNGLDMALAPADAWSRLRLHDVGYVSQFGDLLVELTVLENTALAAQFAGQRRQASLAAARDALAELEIDHLADRHLQTLSGGERQRVAVSRALVNRPRLVVADEPTGSLDQQTSAIVGRLLTTCTSAIGSTLLIVTHNLTLARTCGRAFRIEGDHLVPEC